MKKYWGKAIASIGRNFYQDVTHPSSRKFKFTKEWLSYGLHYENQLCLEKVSFAKIFPTAVDISINLEDIKYQSSNINPYEMYCICSLAKLIQPQLIFEIGTYDGATSLQLARICPSSTIITLDLIPELTLELETVLVQSEAINVDQNGVGSRYIGTPQEKQIKQLWGDSTFFDFSPYYGSIDLVFVDACHEYDYVRKDSETALNLIRPGGIILWHDYVLGWPGVVKAVEEISMENHILHIDGTSLAVLKSVNN